MTERPILFSGPMVRAILGGRKTQTRRVIRDTGLYAIDDAIHGAKVAARERANLLTQSPIKAGDTLWVRETFYDDWEHSRYFYRADADSDGTVPYLIPGHGGGGGVGHARIDKWKPSIFMPRAACRLRLQVTAVRVERLRHISLGDCVAEGMAPTMRNDSENARDRFRALWDSLNAARGYDWESNPWVWAITFERKD